MRRVSLIAGVVGAVGSVGLAACTLDYAIQPEVPQLTTSLVLQAPLDILFVVDNSGSMREEQEALYRSLYDERCPIVDVGNVPPRFQAPTRLLFDELSEVCGIAQLLAAVGGDWHIGVIATDVSNWDERLSAGQDPNDEHTQAPMRGCLQGVGLIDDETPDAAGALRDAIVGLGTYGNPVERGLDAAEIFLDPDSRRAPGCDNDLDGFLRKDGRLVVVYVSDEDDCSHRDGGGGFPDELAGEPIDAGDWHELYTQLSPVDCYERANELQTTASYKAGFDQLIADGRTTDVVVAVMGGVRDDGAGPIAGACIQRDDGVIDGQCLATFGNSGNSAVCTAETNCCTADAASRYVELARSINVDSPLGSICAEDFRTPFMPLFHVGELGGAEVF
ncbi:MAG TPA: hypothetical protein VGF99_11705 [Myxococcota bacterium]